MSIYKRGGVYWYKFMLDGQLVRKSTKQGNDKVALQLESAERTRLAKERDERKAAIERLNCREVLRCPECQHFFDGASTIRDGLSNQQFCSTYCRDTWIKKHQRAPTLRNFCEERVVPWAMVRPSWVWFRSGIRPLGECRQISDLPLDNITSENIATYVADRQSKGLAVGTINRELRVLRRILRLGVEWGLIETMPKIQMLRGEKRRERVVSEVEFGKYLSEATPLLADVAVILIDTGFRPDECHRTRWEEIDWVRDRVLVSEGKTAPARRFIPMTPRVKKAFETRWIGSGRPVEGFVWPSATKSGHIDHSTLKKQHQRAIEQSGVRPFVLYSLRHTFATRIAPHVDAWTLCKIMGWASLSVAMRYIHPSNDSVLQAFGALTGHKIGHTMVEREFLETDSRAVTAEIPVGYLVSAAGFEPATHALKGHCSTN
jgi:integrase